ncbi:MAG: hypothetical protein ACK2TV_08030 [Anaerolineales bacterium]
MFLQQAPAETFNYMVLGFSVILSVLILYILSIVVRFRNLKRDINLLEEVEVEKDSKI